MNTDILIIGAGAAGLFCAIEAAKKGKKALILEHQERIGKKILISGGGRCNFTNLYSNPENFISSNSHFCKSALARFTPKDFISLIEKYKIPYFEKKLGQLFCKTSAKEITNLLLKECQEKKVEIYLDCKIQSVEKNEQFILQTSREELRSNSLVIATGGLSYKNLGATDLGYQIAKQFGINVLEPSPALVPFLWNPEDQEKFSSLSGISIDTIVSFHKAKFRENILFTHRGLSGPAILQISSYWNSGESIQINLFPDLQIEDLLLKEKNNKNRSELKNILAGFLPKRFTEIWCEFYAPSRPLSDYSEKEIRKIAHQLQNWRVQPSGTEGYEKAEVTRGGVDPKELSSQTLQSKKQPGLYFIGEVVDVTGHLGGHNFQWAWASGFAAGQALS